MNKRLLRVTASLLLLSLSASVSAAPITFPFRFVDPASTAQAVGSITFEDSLLLNPGANDFFLPNSAVLALSVTVTGSAAGNGVFGLGDFDEVVFDTNGGTLNFGTELVSQATGGGAWGTPDGSSGDFNLFSGGAPTGANRYSAPAPSPTGVNSPPSGVFFFTLGANAGGDEPMVLTTMGVNGVPGGPAVDLPIGRSAWLALAGLLALGGLWMLRKRAQH